MHFLDLSSNLESFQSFFLIEFPWYNLLVDGWSLFLGFQINFRYFFVYDKPLTILNIMMLWFVIQFKLTATLSSCFMGICEMFLFMRWSWILPH